MSHDAWVWKMPSWPESQVASDGIILELVQEQKITAPISSGRAAGLLERPLGRQERDVVEIELGVEPLDRCRSCRWISSAVMGDQQYAALRMRSSLVQGALAPVDGHAPRAAA